MDDFPTFKKLMVKRNVELQLEALRSFRRKVVSKGKSESFRADDADEIWETLLAQENVRNSIIIYAYNLLVVFSSSSVFSTYHALYSHVPVHSSRKASEADEQQMSLLHDTYLEMSLMQKQERLEEEELAAALAVSSLSLGAESKTDEYGIFIVLINRRRVRKIAVYCSGERWEQGVSGCSPPEELPRALDDGVQGRGGREVA